MERQLLFRQIVGIDTTNQRVVCEDLLDIFLSWVEKSRYGGPVTVIPPGPGTFPQIVNKRLNSELRAERATSKQGTYLSGTLTHDDLELGGQRRWSSLLEIAETTGRIQVRASLGCEGRISEQPTWNPPSFLRQIHLSFNTTVAGEKIALEACAIENESDSKELADYIHSTERNFPVILVAPRYGTEEYPIAPDKLAERALGIGEVCYFDNHSLAESFGHRIGGDDWSCFNGGIRVYFPGITDDSSVYDHPLLPFFRFSPVELNKLLMRAAAYSRQSESEGSLFLKLRQAARSENVVAEAEKQLQLIHELSEENRAQLIKLQEEIQTYDGLLAMAETENETLKDAISALQDKNSHLETQLEDKTNQLRIVNGDFQNISEGLDYLSRRYEAVLEVSPQAWKTAEKAGRPQRLGRLIQDIRMACEIAAELSRSPDTRIFIDRLKKAGLNVSKESETTENDKRLRMLRKAQLFGQEKDLQWHIKVGDNDKPDEVLRAYFDYEMGTGRLGIGFCGNKTQMGY